MTQKYIKIVGVVILIGGLFVIFRVLPIDFSSISEEKFEAWVESLGFWGPLVYIGVYILRPLILFPAGVLSATAGIIWGRF